MKITYYGHACFEVQTGHTRLLFDPFITPNSHAKHIRLSDIKADYILLSHGHIDHLADAAVLARQTNALLISNWEICAWFEKQGISKTYALNHGGTRTLPFGRVKYVYAQHSSSLPDGSYGGNPGGFVVESTEGTFYYSGDTALLMDMKIIGDSFQLKFAALPIGDNFTMGYEDAARAAAFLNVRDILGLHYDTFPPIQIDHAVVMAHFERAGLHLHLPAIGDSITL